MAASARFPDLRPDWPLLRHALAQLGISASTVVWTDPEVKWEEFDLVVANGAWDNIHRPDEFVAWADRVAAVTGLVNSPDTLRWNLDKRYLDVLAAAGVPTVPTAWLESRSPVPDLPGGQYVVKPTVSGGSFQTARYGPGDDERARAHIERLLGEGRTVMVQPFQPSVDAEGETGVVFLGGRYSHAINKGPMLRPGEDAVDGLWHHEVLRATTPTPAHLEAARQALDTAESLLGPTTYARVDLVTRSDGTPAVLELELLDPALFFELHPEGAPRFARVLRDRLR